MMERPLAMEEERGTTEAEHEALERVAFDPTTQHLDLSKDERLRTTALMLAIKYVTDTICRDATMYQALKADGEELVSANIPHVLQSAIQFESFLLGRLQEPKEIDGKTKNTEKDRAIPS